MLLNLTLDFGSDIARARATYAAALPSGSSEPSLDDLIADGWLRVVWGRIATPFEITQAARSAPAGTMTAFVALMETRFKEGYHLSDAARSDPVLAAAVAAIDGGDVTPRAIGCKTPQWVAARLWDRPAPAADVSAALRIWVDKWFQLGCPSLVPAQVWDENTAKIFREAAINVLGSEPSLLGWEEMRTRFAMQIALTSGQSLSSVKEFAVPPIPGTLPL